MPSLRDTEQYVLVDPQLRSGPPQALEPAAFGSVALPS